MDDPRLGGDYAQRRLALSTRKDLPFKLYPLKEKFSTMSQLTHSKRRVFIDSEGKIVTYKPTKNYKVEYTKVLRIDKTWNGLNRLMTKLPVTFVTEEAANYVGYVQVGNAYYLYDLTEHRKAPHRKKL